MSVTKCAQLFFLLHTYNAQYNPVMWPWELPPPAVCTGASSSEEEFANQSNIAEPSLQSATQTPPRDPRGTFALCAPRWSHPVSKVPQCVQSVANTRVQWFPTNTRVQVELLKWQDGKDTTKHRPSHGTGSSPFCYVNMPNDLYKYLIYGLLLFQTTTASFWIICHFWNPFKCEINCDI